MAEPSDDTKKTASSMISRVGKSSLGGAKKVASSVGKLFTKKPENIIPHPSGPTETLGEIFKIMKVMDEDRRANQEMANAHIEEQKHEKDRRNDEIIKALTARKPPKPPRVKKEKKVEEKKPEEKKPPEKKEPEKKAEDKTAKTKADKEAKDKAAKEAKDKAETEKRAKDSAEKVKEEKKAKETAERAKKEESDKKEKESAERVKKEETKKAKEEAKTTAKKQEKPTPVIPPTGNVAKATLIAALAAEGYSQTAQANILANVKHESDFIPQTENLGRYTGKNLFTLYGGPEVKQTKNGRPLNAAGNIIRFQSLEEANDLVKQGPAAVAEVIYGGRMGNKEPGDAYKYIGRGFIQLTGRENYEKVGKLIGVDLVNNPELANDPKIAAKIVPAFFKVGGKKPKDLEDIDKAISAVGSASEKSRIERRKLSAEYQAKGFGDQLDTSSITNADGKKELNSQQAQTQQNVNVINQNISQPDQSIPPKPNDTNPLLAKVKGQPK
jgi:predicted chitinase